MPDPYITNLMLLRAKQRRPLFLGQTATEVGQSAKPNTLDRHEVPLRGPEPPDPLHEPCSPCILKGVLVGILVLGGLLWLL